MINCLVSPELRSLGTAPCCSAPPRIGARTGHDRLPRHRAPMTLVETFVRADRAITAAIASTAGAPPSARVGPVFATEPADGVPLGAAVAHIARDEAWIPAQLAGRTMAEVGPEAFDGDLLGDDPAGAFARLAALAQDAAGAVTDLGATVHCSF